MFRRCSCLPTRVLLIRFLPLFLCLLPTGTSHAAPDDEESAGTHTQVVAWNNLGMHCMDDDYSVFSLLPPYNVLFAQVMRNGNLVASATGLNVTYEAVADPQGSINRTSVGKTNFWSHVADLFGVSPALDLGLAGFAMPGAANTPQPMTFDSSSSAFVAEGIPISPYDDSLTRNPYPLMRVTVRDGSNQILATTDSVLPVADELDCRACHASGSGPAAEPGAGWVNDPDPARDHRLNILLLHDELNLANPQYLLLLQTMGYNPAGLYPTVTVNGTSVLCAACHLSNALPGTGASGLQSLTQALHGRHAGVIDPTNGLPLDQASNRSACYRCHPGSETRCLRGAMGAAVANDGSLAMQCQDCHGSMSEVGNPTRDGWLDEPTCQNCHTGTATNNSGKIRYTSVFDAPGHLRIAANQTFATNPNTPTSGKSLYRLSTGHGDLLCEACHGATHAIYPSSQANDNLQSIALQGHQGTLGECSACHDGQPSTVSGGPHGMHPVGDAWVRAHDGEAEHDGAAACRACHGNHYRGTVLSEAFGNRTLNTKFGMLQLWPGFRVSCYTCHDGPTSESRSNNHPARVKHKSAATDDLTPVNVKLSASDQDGDSLRFRIVDQPARGTVGLNGKIATYYPALGFIGTETFKYAAFDGMTDSNLGKVTVSVEDGSCPVALSEPTHLHDRTGGLHTFDVNLPAECAWTATVDAGASAWLSIQGASSGTGFGTITCSVAASSSPNARAGTVTVNGKLHEVRQGGLDSADLEGTITKANQKCQGSGCVLKLILKVRNLGGSKATKSLARLYLSTDATLDAGDTFLRSKSYGKIKPGKSQKRKFTAQLPGGASATGQYVIAVLDADQAVVEANDGNNVVVFGPLP